MTAETLQRWARTADQRGNVPPIATRWLGSHEPTPVCPKCDKTFTVHERPWPTLAAHTRRVDTTEHAVCGHVDMGPDALAEGAGHPECLHCDEQQRAA